MTRKMIHIFNPNWKQVQTHYTMTVLIPSFNQYMLGLNLVKPFLRAAMTPFEFRESEEVDKKQITPGTKTGSRVFLA